MLRSETLRSWVAALPTLDRDVGDQERIDQLRLLEELKSAAAAAQAVVTADFAASQRAEQRAAGVPEKRVGQGIASQIGLARRDSAHRGGRHLGLAEALVRELPETLAALRRGVISEWRATIVARETACLSPDERRVADAELARLLEGASDRKVEAEARRIAYRLDPHAFMARTKGEEKHRRVTLRPAPITMGRLTGFVPVAMGVAALASLRAEADRLVAAGDERSRDQIMADVFCARLTGQSSVEGLPVEVRLVMTRSAMLGEDDEPAELLEGGLLPAPVARALLREAKGQAWVRRLFTRPEDGALVGMDSRRRYFPEGLRELLVMRDRVCRTPWCGAPIRHADHVVASAEGGDTSEANGEGLCAACNYAKQALGWQARPGPGGAGESVEITTPTGHVYSSRPPPLPRQGSPQHAPPRRRPKDRDSLLESKLRELLVAA